MERKQPKRSAVVPPWHGRFEGIELEVEKGGVFGIPEIEIGGNDGRKRGCG